MPLGDKVRALREQRGWSQRELARRAQVRAALISELETGKKTDTTGSVLRRLARTLGVTVDYLAGVYNDESDVGSDRCTGEVHRLAALALPQTTIPSQREG